MKLVKTIFELDAYGEKYNLTEPSVKTVQQFQLRMKDENADDIEIMLDFLKDCGLPREVSSEMPASHVAQVMERLVPKKS